MSKKKNKNRNNSPQRQEVTKRLNEELKQDSEGVSAEVQMFSLDSPAEKAEKKTKEAAPKKEQEAAPREEAAPKKEQEAAPREEAVQKKEQEVRDEPTETDALIESMNTALGGTYEEVAEETEESEEATEVVTEKRPNKFYLIFAVFIIIMSIIGVYSTVRFVADGITEIANQTSLKNEIALFIYPVVAVDPPAFTTVEEMPSSVAVESALWRIILTGDTSNYEKLYNTYMYVPAVDVEFNIRSLFGNAVTITHQTVGSTGTAFTYNEDTNTYLVPISPRYTAYSPVITEISNVGELYTVRVKYMPPTALAIEGINLQEGATKEMEYTLSKSKNSMTLHSIKNATSIGEGYEY